MSRTPFLLAVIATLTLISVQPVIPQENDRPEESPGILLLNEISPWPSDGEVWVELLNVSDNPISPAGWTVEFLSGYSFVFPDDATSIPAGALHVLTISGDNPLNASGDGCVLYSQDVPVDAVSWGTPPYFDLPFPIGPPVARTRGYIPEGESITHSDNVILRIIGTSEPGSHNWLERGADAASRSAANPIAGPERYSPEDGAYLASDFALYVTGVDWATSVTFQVASDEAFSDVVLEETVEGRVLEITDIEPGTYFWRVRISKNGSGAWSDSHEFTREPFDIDDLPLAEDIESRSDHENTRLAEHKGGGNNRVILTRHEIPCTHIYQNKDTCLVCIDGCNMNGHCRWCSPHGMATDCDHGACYCTRASLAMLAQTGGCTLSQDRITYYLFEEAGTAARAAIEAGHIGDPHYDIGKHGEGTYDEDCRLALAWIYNQPVSSVQNLHYHPDIFDDQDRSDMDSIREFILDDRAIIRHSDDHSTLITGCAVVLSGQGNEIPYIKVYDPGTPNRLGWTKIDKEPDKFKWFTFPPTTGRPVRNDEISISMDSDQDGLVDFDETERFGTDPNNRDTDGDGIEDMVDMLAYTFKPDGSFFPREADIDGDGAWKELDPDNDWADNSGMSDGCEDSNTNGFCEESVESDCLNQYDDFQVFNPECMRGLIRYVNHEEHDTRFGPREFLLEESILMQSFEDHPLDSTDYIYDHRWIFKVLETYIPPSPGTSSARQHSIDTGKADAMVTLNRDENTGDFHLTMDTQPQTDTATLIYSWPELGEYEEREIPVMFMLSQGVWDYIGMGPIVYNIGQPVRTSNGSLMLRGDWNPDLGQAESFTGEPRDGGDGYDFLFCWEILLEPPE